MIQLYMCIFFSKFFPIEVLTKQSFLSYTVGPCWLFILFIKKKFFSSVQLNSLNFYFKWIGVYGMYDVTDSDHTTVYIVVNRHSWKVADLLPLYYIGVGQLGS